MKRLLKFLSGLLTAVLVMVIAAAGALAFSARRSQDAIPTVLGHKVMTVLSGSMEPFIHTGDVIIVKPVTDARQEVSDGDVITFRMMDKPDMLITHRVVGTLKVNGAAAGWTTKGDNNATMDTAVVAPEQVIGRYEWRVPYFGYISSFLRKPLGVALFVILPGLFLIGIEFKKIWVAVNEAEEAEKAAAKTGGDEATK